MTSNKFFFQLFALTLLLIGICLLWGQYSLYIAEYNFLYLGLTFFLSFISILSFFLSQKATSSENVHNFTKVFLGSTFVKMVGSVVFLLVYLKRYPPDPDDHTFILPFLMIYLAFTIFEVMFLSRLGQTVTLKPEEDNFIDYIELEKKAEASAASTTDEQKDDDDENPPFEPPTLSPFQK